MMTKCDVAPWTGSQNRKRTSGENKSNINKLLTLFNDDVSIFFINFNKCTILIYNEYISKDVNNRGNHLCMCWRIIGNFLYYFLKFSVRLKLLKHKVYL